MIVAVRILEIFLQLAMICICVEISACVPTAAAAAPALTKVLNSTLLSDSGDFFLARRLSTSDNDDNAAYVPYEGTPNGIGYVCTTGPYTFSNTYPTWTYLACTANSAYAYGYELSALQLLW